MNCNKHSCPCCSHQLLRHIRQQQLTWFCCHCRQEMPIAACTNSVISQSNLFSINSDRPQASLVAS